MNPLESKQIIEKAVVRIQSIANDLLGNDTYFGSASEGSTPLVSTEAVALAVKEIYEEKILLWSDFSLSFKIELSNVTGFCKASLPELKRIVSNLFDNAFESLQEKRCIQVVLKIFEDELILSVNDSGTGLQKEILNKIGREQVTTKENGNGLGFLSGVEKINSWGGALEIFPNEDQGTIATIRLPLIF